MNKSIPDTSTAGRRLCVTLLSPVKLDKKKYLKAKFNQNNLTMFERNRTKPFLILYALYLYFLGLSLRSTSKALEPFNL
jgi:hypothetical protein